MDIRLGEQRRAKELEIVATGFPRRLLDPIVRRRLCISEGLLQYLRPSPNLRDHSERIASGHDLAIRCLWLQRKRPNEQHPSRPIL